MTIFPRDRKWLTILALVLAALGGAASGFLLGRVRTLHLTEARLGKSATKLEGLLDAFLNESVGVLDTLNASTYEPCSDAELAWMRQLVYHSAYLRDAGHMRNGTLECAAGFGTAKLPKTTFQPTARPWKDLEVYTNVPPYGSGTFPVFLLQRGNSFVVEDPGFESYWQQIYNNYDVYVPASPTGGWVRPSGRHSSRGDMVIDRNWQGITGDTVYATRCAPDNTSCTVALGSYSAELYSDRVQLTLSTSLGALSGALLMLLYLFLYRYNHSMAQQLRRDIRRDKLRVVYQPIVELATRRIVEAEALVRWTDDNGNAVSPEIFVRAAEMGGFVGELTELVVRHALRDLGEMLRRSPGFRLNVNVTAADLIDPHFLAMLDRQLATAGVAPQSLTIEVTEGSTARRQEAIETIRQLRRRGHCVQIDDFGTGYSSLAYLKDLDVDAIKIDKTFTHTIGTEAVIGDILPQILAMAQSLDLMVIAEGIETPEQAEYFAASTQAVLGQGWLFGRPTSAVDLQARVEASEPTDCAELLASA